MLLRGAGGIALAGSLRAALSPARTGLLAAPARTGQYDKNILTGEIRKFQDLQVFELKGKDARGYDFAVQLSPVDAIPLMNEKADAVNADRVKVYIGGNPENVKDISTEIEIAMGKEAEAYKINSASVAYIPK